MKSISGISKARCFLDSNIWLYGFIRSDNAQKSARARTIIEADQVLVSTQIINEACINLIRKAAFSEEQVRRLIASFYRRHDRVWMYYDLHPVCARVISFRSGTAS